jgi:hypothetical protein
MWLPSLGHSLCALMRPAVSHFTGPARAHCYALPVDTPNVIFQENFYAKA